MSLTYLNTIQATKLNLLDFEIDENEMLTLIKKKLVVDIPNIIDECKLKRSFLNDK